MLARLHQRLRKAPQAVQSNVRPLHGDMRNLRLSGRFPLVLATFNVVGHLATFKDMGRFLTHARAHLAPGGRLAFDVPLPHGDEIEADPDELFPAPRFRHPDTKEWIYQTERFEYSPGTQQLLVESSYRAGDRPDILTVPLVLRQWFPKELEAILYFEGFSQVQTFADYTQNPGLFARDSLVFVAAV
jgi:SAM-dependent methyltransferase